ncbi:MAG: hypothetical protein KGY67_09060 [Candidatus Thermoplasmatota archaeon]|nr:hypothetical protein [Candidatus Thermoplasmatota archaeon]
MKNKKYLGWIIAGSILVSAIIFTYFFIVFTYEYSSTISVEKLESKPEKFVNMTTDELDNLSYLKKAYLTNKTLEVPYNEKDQIMEIRNFFMEAKTFNVKINDSYYEVSFTSS